MKVNNSSEMAVLLEALKNSNQMFKSKDENSTENIWSAKLKEMEDTSLGYRLDSIARRIARGDFVSGKDKSLLIQHNPEKLQKAEIANTRRMEVALRLKSARSKQEAREIISNARVEVYQAFSSKDEEYTVLLSEAYNKLTEDYSGNKLTTMVKKPTNKLDIKI
ncbi:hypothetical protein ACP8HI_07335 [Paenibacillus sp. FA6]|uniref:hypothetical protein n=1 Tax=Paenibacillus sp. FA6 TaxID=3413029 RepID=UPI003F65D3E1